MAGSPLLGNICSGYLDGEKAYISDPFIGRGGSWLDLLQAEGDFTLQSHLPLFQQVSKAIDDSVELGVPGLELNPNLIFVDDGSISPEELPQNSDGWLEYYKQKSSQSSTFARDSSLTLLPKLEEASDEQDIQATVTLEDLATDPLTKFASLIYRSISGMSVRATAYMRESAYVSTSNLGEESNLFLAEIIAGQSEMATATEIIVRLCECEGVTWCTELLDQNLAKRAREKKSYAEEIRGAHQLLKDALNEDKIQRAAAKKDLEAQEKQKSEAKKKSTSKKKAASKKKTVSKKKAAAKKKQATAEAKKETEAEKKEVEAEAKKVAEAEKKRVEEEAEKAAEAEKKRVAAEAKKAAEAEKKRVEAEAKKAAEAEKKRVEAEVKKAAEAEKKRVAEEAKRAAEAEKQQKILVEQKHAAEEQKQESIRLKKEALEATKLAEREQKALAKQRRDAEKAKAKAERERKKLVSEETGGGTKPKKKIFILAGAALLTLLLGGLIVILSGSNGDGESGDKKIADDISSSSTATNSVTPPSKDEPSKPKKEPSFFVMEIPLADGGKAIPKGTVLNLTSLDGNSIYARFEKKSGSLIAKIENESKPSEDKYAIRVATTSYKMLNPISFAAEEFIEADSNTFKRKHPLQVSINAEFRLVPVFDGLGGALAEYREVLLKMLAKKGIWKLADRSGASIDGAGVSYESSSDEVKISLPSGWSIKEKPVNLQINWPGLDPITVRITQKGIEDKPWSITLSKYTLDLSKLKAVMPKFEKIRYEPIINPGSYQGLSSLLDDLVQKEYQSYTLGYDQLEENKWKASVTSLSGNLHFSGGVIHKRGLKILGAVKEKKLISSFPSFPTGFFHGFVHVPLNPSGVEWITAPGLSSVDWSTVNEESAGFVFKILFVGPNDQWVEYGSTLKLLAWNVDDRSWLLQSDSGLPIQLKVGQASTDRPVTYVYTEITPQKFGTIMDKPSSGRNLKLLLKEGSIYASIPMKMTGDTNRQSYLNKIDAHLSSIHEEYRVITKNHGYHLPETYPPASRQEMKKLASEE